MTTLTNKLPLLHVVAALVLGVGAARSSVVKLCGTAHDAVAAVTNLRRAEVGIELCRVRRGRILEWSQNHAVTDMAGGAGDAFLLVIGIIVLIGDLDGPLHARARDVLDDGRLLILQRRMAVKTHPAMFVL